MALDIASLTSALSEEAPSGPDLSYDDERITIESVFERSVSTDSVAEDDQTNWREIIGLITSQAERTRDIWLPVYLMRAAASSGQLDLLCEGAELLASLLEERWGDVHPQLDEYGFIGRKTPCESLTRKKEFLNPLANLTLIEHARLGRYSGADFMRMLDKGSKADGFGMFRALIEATSEDDLVGIVTKIDGLRDAIKRADAALTANAEDDTATNFQTTYEAIAGIRKAVAANLPAGDADSAETDGNAPSGPSSVGGPSSGGPGFSGGINSRDDVARALDAICGYYARNEPASPVPFALRRAKDWISLDFMAVLEDIAPGGVDEAVRVLKSGRSDSGGSDDGWGSGSDAEPAADDSWASDESSSTDTSDGW